MQIAPSCCPKWYPKLDILLVEGSATIANRLRVFYTLRIVLCIIKIFKALKKKNSVMRHVKLQQDTTNKIKNKITYFTSIWESIMSVTSLNCGYTCRHCCRTHEDDDDCPIIACVRACVCTTHACPSPYAHGIAHSRVYRFHGIIMNLSIKRMKRKQTTKPRTKEWRMKMRDAENNRNQRNTETNKKS